MSKQKYTVMTNFTFPFTGDSETSLLADEWRITDRALTFYIENTPVMVFNNRSWTTFYQED